LGGCAEALEDISILVDGPATVDVEDVG